MCVFKTDNNISYVVLCSTVCIFYFFKFVSLFFSSQLLDGYIFYHIFSVYHLFIFFILISLSPVSQSRLSTRHPRHKVFRYTFRAWRRFDWQVQSCITFTLANSYKKHRYLCSLFKRSDYNICTIAVETFCGRSQLLMVPHHSSHVRFQRKLFQFQTFLKLPQVHHHTPHHVHYCAFRSFHLVFIRCAWYPGCIPLLLNILECNIKFFLEKLYWFRCYLWMIWLES